MFTRFKRVKRRGKEYEYFLLVENQRIDGVVRQRILHNFGRRDELDPEQVRQTLAKWPTFGYLQFGGPWPRKVEVCHYVVQTDEKGGARKEESKKEIDEGGEGAGRSSARVVGLA